MDLFIENLNFKYGLMLWEERFNIIKEIEDNVGENGQDISVLDPDMRRS